MKKGFTLIELLAVIVILAIIALIATPIILNIINDSKEESNKRSVEMYGKALENAVATYQLKKRKNTTKFTDIESYIEYDGNVECNVIEINRNGTVYIEECIVNKQKVEYAYGIEGDHHLSRNNVKAATEETKTTGLVPTQDENKNIVPGSEFKIKVNDTSKYLPFFVLSNSEDGKYVNLIAEQNITSAGEFTSEQQANNEWNLTSTNSNDNRYGPQTAYTYLNNATSNWTNIPMIESFNYLDEGNQSNSTYGYQSIITKLDNQTGKYITTITPLSSSYGKPVIYENMRTRLPYESEIIENTKCKRYTNSETDGSCPLWMVNYLTSSSYYSTTNGKINSKSLNYAYWILSSYSDNWTSACSVRYHGNIGNTSTNYANYGIRPVITVLKSDLLRVMQ